MDLNKVGAFVAECRKTKGLTQKQLAEKLGVTDSAVSKWERGNSLPDATLMVPLCEFFGISVTELLNGERVAQQEVAAVAQKQIVSLLKQRRENRRKLFWNIAIGIIGTVVLVESIILALFYIDNTPRMIITIAGGVVIFLVCELIAIMIDWDTGYLECRHCGISFAKRRFKCPACKKWSWDKSK